jgi:pimeloyl-ACP methyl ester carboxylesterase
MLGCKAVIVLSLLLTPGLSALMGYQTNSEGLKTHTFASTAAASPAPVLLPKPTGPYPVGRRSFHLVDPSRTDVQGSRSDHEREFMVVVWYPSELNANAPRAPWLPSQWEPLEANGFLGMQLDRSSNAAAKDFHGVMGSVEVAAREDAPLARASKPFPILVFSPGNRMFPTEYSSLLEDLASHGYVVIGHVPTGWVSVAFPDGHTTSRSDHADFSLWTGDLKFILDQAAGWNASRDSMFFGRLDLNRVGVFGHSGGANAAAIAAHQDKRLKALLVLDTGLLNAQNAIGPALAFTAENADYFRRHPDDYTAIIGERDAFLRKSKPGIAVTLKGADHNSFTDLSVIKALERPSDGQALIETVRAFLRDYFDEFLLSRHSDLIRRDSVKYPLAKVEVID